MDLVVGELDPLRFQAHPEVWLVIAGVIGLGVYVGRVIAPKIPESESGGGPAITRAQKAWFAFGVLLLWFASDWPLHDLAEQDLYSLHMIQHFVLTMVMPPVFLLATPPWLARLAFPETGRAWPLLRRLARPVPAAVLFNALVIATHWTVVVNTSVQVGAVHYLVHLVIVSSALIMWVPVCGPWPELRLTAAGACVYLFVQSIIPTVPGAWLTMAGSPVYSAYDHLPRLWGISVIEDQQYAGLIMKLLGGSYLWALIVSIFFRWALRQERADRRAHLVLVDDGAGGPVTTDASVAAVDATVD